MTNDERLAKVTWTGEVTTFVNGELTTGIRVELKTGECCCTHKAIKKHYADQGLELLPHHIKLGRTRESRTVYTFTKN